MTGSLGNVINSLILLSIVVYLCCIVAHVTGVLELIWFGKHWATDGFCVSFKETVYDTHLLCFYGDAIAAVILAVLAHGKSDRSEFNVVKNNVGATFMHGAAHAMLWYAKPKGNASLVQSIGEHTQVAVLFVLVWGFYFAFLHFKDWQKRSISAIATGSQCAFHAAVTVSALPPQYLFTYANTVLFFSGVGSEMFCKSKDRFYDMHALLCALPPAIVAWLEPLTCDNFLVNWGGHLWFDLSIPFGVMMYYCIVIKFEQRDKKVQ